VRTPLALLAVAACLAGCSSGGGDSSAPAGPPSVSTLPTSGTAIYTDGRVYTVAPSGSLLRLDDLSVRVQSVVWTRHVTFKEAGFAPPPGTKIYSLVTLTVENRTHRRQTVGLTQIWLRDGSGHPHLATAQAQVPRDLLSMRIGPGASVTGTLVYPTPRRESGYLLVYRFADAKAIARARHVGLLRYP
jgi:Domain of unknown function (DUF4352)